MGKIGDENVMDEMSIGGENAKRNFVSFSQ
jgi:hypothetical protein